MARLGVAQLRCVARFPERRTPRGTWPSLFVQPGRCFATYAEHPARWQSDPCVQMYGQLLAVRDAQEEAFLVAAETLRTQVDLPRDLRASASRTRASVLFKKAATSFQALHISLEEPWPEAAFEEALGHAAAAAEAYAQALKETGDPALIKEVEPHVPDWPKVLAHVSAAHTEVLKLRAELRFRQIRWHSRQAEHARVLGERARKGKASADDASIAAEALEKAGLPMTTEEQNLLAVSADACEKLVGECIRDGDGTGSETSLLRSRAEAYRALVLKDLAIAHALVHELEAAVGHAVAALDMRVEDSILYTTEAAEQVRAAAEGVFVLCGHELRAADTQLRGEQASFWAAKIATAMAKFDHYRKEC